MSSCATLLCFLLLFAKTAADPSLVDLTIIPPATIMLNSKSSPFLDQKTSSSLAHPT